MVKADAKTLEASLHSEVLQQNLVLPKKSLDSRKKVYMFLCLIIYYFTSVGWIFVFIAVDTGTQCWRDLKCWQTKERVEG